MPLEEFSWIPKELFTTYLIGLRERFKKHGRWEMLPGALWDQDTMAFITKHEELSVVAHRANNAWLQKTRNMNWAAVTAVLLAIESLASNFNGYGDRFPDAKLKADELYEKGELTDRTRLLNIYLPNRSQLEQLSKFRTELVNFWGENSEAVSRWDSLTTEQKLAEAKRDHGLESDLYDDYRKSLKKAREDQADGTNRAMAEGLGN